MEKEFNPFLIEGYINGTYFCDRTTETESLSEALENGRNVTLLSPRRMGKSGLICHTFAMAKKKNKNISCFYIDIFHTHSLSEFISAFADAVFRAFDTKIERMYADMIKVFKHCRPVIEPDGVTGLPKLMLNIVPGNETHTLKEIFEYLKKSGRRIYIAFDEFQQIAEYPEKGVEALLRSYIQFTPNINFIFSGSKKHIMQQMFTLPSGPFYQSTQTLTLKEISQEKYYTFSARFFAKTGRKLSKEAFYFMYETVFGHTWYMQYWLNKLYAGCRAAEISVTEAREVLIKILKEEEDNFYTYSRMMTQTQLSVLKALACEGRTSSPYSSELVKKYNLPAPSTTQSCLKTLLEKEVILEERGSYSVYNRFYMLWLKLF